MRILVTGANGFIGGYVLDALAERHIEVLAFDRRLPSAPRADVEHFIGDVRDGSAVAEAVGLADGVIHLAGILGTSETVDDPRPSVETNILGTLNVLQALRRHPGRRGSYITVGNYWYLNSYSISKTTAEALVWMFNREHGTQVAVIRALNAYGPGQKDRPVRKIAPNFILAALRGDPITVYGDGEQVMDMIFVADVADVLVRALLVDHGQYRYLPTRNEDNAVKFEAGTGRVTTVNDVARIVLDLAGGGTVQHVPMREGEPPRSVVLGNPETLRPLYGGALPSLTPLEEGLARTVAWYRDRRA